MPRRSRGPRPNYNPLSEDPSDWEPAEESYEDWEDQEYEDYLDRGEVE